MQDFSICRWPSSFVRDAPTASLLVCLQTSNQRIKFLSLIPQFPLLPAVSIIVSIRASFNKMLTNIRANGKNLPSSEYLHRNPSRFAQARLNRGSYSTPAHVMTAPFSPTPRTTSIPPFTIFLLYFLFKQAKPKMPLYSYMTHQRSAIETIESLYNVSAAQIEYAILFLNHFYSSSSRNDLQSSLWDLQRLSDI
jgi:hypothetical protein